MGRYRSEDERRHRINEDEVPQVISGLRRQLNWHVELKTDFEGAENAFRTFYRLSELGGKTGRRGRPNYPDNITWGLIEDFLSVVEEMVPLSPEVEVPAR